MPFSDLEISEVATIAGQFSVTVIGAGVPPIGPGQCWLVQPADPALLPIAVFPLPSGSQYQFWASAQDLAQPDSPLAAIEPGAILRVLGPVGRKWLPPGAEGRLLVAAADPGRAWPLARLALESGWSVAWHWRFRVPEWAGQILPPAVEFHAGRLTSELIDWADMVLVDHADPAAYLKELRGLGRLRHAGRAFACQLPAMPCGFGGCQGCWTQTRQGRSLACVDGPWVML